MPAEARMPLRDHFHAPLDNRRSWDEVSPNFFPKLLFPKPPRLP
jgi:hypothetical protein